MKKSDPPIITTQCFSCSQERLWIALTDPTEMKKWYFPMMPDFKANIGFKTSFLISVEDRNYTHQWEVTQAILQEKLKCRWTYEEHPGDSYVTFDISKKGDEVCLTVTCDIIEDFPQNLPEFKRESAVDGWKYLIQKSLVEYINN